MLIMGTMAIDAIAVQSRWVFFFLLLKYFLNFSGSIAFRNCEYKTIFEEWYFLTILWSRIYRCTIEKMISSFIFGINASIRSSFLLDYGIDLLNFFNIPAAKMIMIDLWNCRFRESCINFLQKNKHFLLTYFLYVLQKLC